jgi:L-threonylcarbamoyladenylate synthase
MDILRIDPSSPKPTALAEADAVLRRGGLVVYPTETAYALGCDATNSAGMKKIFKIKRRESWKPLPLIAASTAMVRRFAKLEGLNARLAASFWPGSLTLILPSPIHLRSVTAVTERRSVAVRVSAHPVARELSRRLGRPIVSTSANLSGGPNPYSAMDVLRQLGLMPDLVLDAGRLPKRSPSTIVRCDECCCEILRPGPIAEKEIHASLQGHL